MLSPGDFKMLSKEGRSKPALQLSDFFLIFFFFCLFCPCKVKKLSHITLLLNTREHTGLCGICCHETTGLLALENRNHSWSSPRALVSCGRNAEARMLPEKRARYKTISLFTVTPLLIKTFMLRTT